MNRKKGKLLLAALVAILFLGVGYAAISSVGLSISGLSSAKANGTNEDFKVRFVKAAAADNEYVANASENAILKSGELANGIPMDSANLSASVTGDLTAEFAINELATVGDFAEFTYYVVNESEDIDAELSFDISNKNNQKDYFTITKSVNKTVLGNKEIAAFKVKVELIKAPKIEDVYGNFEVTLTATPREKGTVQNDANGLTATETTVEVATASALKTALLDPETSKVVMDDNISILDSNIAVTKDQEVTIDLNGNELTSTIDVDGNLTIDDSTSDGKLIARSGKYTMKVNSGGNVNMNSGNLEAPDYYGVYLDGGSMTINGGSITSKYSVVSSNNTTGIMDLTINGGEFTAQNGNVIYMPGPRSLTINDGVFNGGLLLRMGNVTINGGTINSVASGEFYGTYTANYNYSGNVWFGDAITVLGGTYTGGSNGSNDLNLNITGGTFNSISGGGTALGIVNLGKVAQEMNVTITGGTFNTTTSDRDTFEIYSANDINATDAYKQLQNSVDVTITGGTGLTGVTESGTYTSKN